MNVELLLCRIPCLLEDRVKNVGEATQTLAVELFWWIDPVLETLISSLISVQVILYVFVFND